MHSSFYKTKLKNILSAKRGTSLSGKYYATRGNKIRLTLGNFNYPNGGFKHNTSKDNIFFIGNVKDEFILKKGDIITPLTEQVAGLLGETARIPEDNTYIQSGDIALIIPKENKLDASFAYYLVSSKSIKLQLGAAAQQTKIRHTSPEKIENCEAWIPENILVQKNIGVFLDLLNQKIELNNKINFELEQIAKELYNYWFVQFDFPGENGRPYKSSGGKMVYNEVLKREIPEGWKVITLRNICKITRGISYDKNDVSDTNIDGYTPIFRANNIENGHINYNSLVFVPNELISNSQFISNNDIIMTMSSGSLNHLGKTYKAKTNMNYSYGAFCSKITPLNGYRHYLSSYLSSLSFQTYIKNMCLGTNINNLNNEHIYNATICIPDAKTLNKFSNILDAVYSSVGTKEQENIRFTRIRDFLLPMLMNGQVIVNSAH